LDAYAAKAEILGLDLANGLSIIDNSTNFKTEEDYLNGSDA
jgi:hypothetical protein